MNSGQVGGVAMSGGPSVPFNTKWLAVDLDGTLAKYDGWKGEDHIGELIEPMAEKIIQRFNEGWQIAIFTARVSSNVLEENVRAERIIWAWLESNKIDMYINGITATKHKHFREFWDDRAFNVVPNTGMIRDFEPVNASLDILIGCSLDQQVGGSHYKDMVIQPAEYCEYNNIPALEAAVIKYISRHQNKNGVQDLEKAKDLINMIIEMRYEPTGLNHLAARINQRRHNNFEKK